MNDTTAALLWIDLEMTGLEHSKDKILEVAAIVTDWNLQELASFESGVGHDAAEVEILLNANAFYVKMPQNKTALLELTKNSPPSNAVEQQMVSFIKQHCDTTRPLILAGNSIHIDRQFIKAAWPYVEQLLHYRMLDVTAWKLVFENKYKIEVKKQEKHRALDDIRESIAELKQYMEHINDDAQRA